MASYKAPASVERIARAELHIAQAQERIAHQMAFIEWLVMTGRDSRAAASCLRTMEDTLAALRTSRDLIRRVAGTAHDAADHAR
jgi:hypothetical protein